MNRRELLRRGLWGPLAAIVGWPLLRSRVTAEQPVKMAGKPAASVLAPGVYSVKVRGGTVAIGDFVSMQPDGTWTKAVTRRGPLGIVIQQSWDTPELGMVWIPAEEEWE